MHCKHIALLLLIVSPMLYSMGHEDGGAAGAGASAAITGDEESKIIDFIYALARVDPKAKGVPDAVLRAAVEAQQEAAPVASEFKYTKGTLELLGKQVAEREEERGESKVQFDSSSALQDSEFTVQWFYRRKRDNALVPIPESDHNLIFPYAERTHTRGYHPVSSDAARRHSYVNYTTYCPGDEKAINYEIFGYVCNGTEKKFKIFEVIGIMSHLWSFFQTPYRVKYCEQNDMYYVHAANTCRLYTQDGGFIKEINARITYSRGSDCVLQEPLICSTDVVFYSKNPEGDFLYHKYYFGKLIAIKRWMEKHCVSGPKAELLKQLDNSAESGFSSVPAIPEVMAEFDQFPQEMKNHYRRQLLLYIAPSSPIVLEKSVLPALEGGGDVAGTTSVRVGPMRPNPQKPKERKCVFY